MLERLRNCFDGKLRDCLKVVLPNVGVVGVVTLADLKLYLELLLILLSLAHTAWRWRRDAKNTDKKPKEEDNEIRMA